MRRLTISVDDQLADAFDRLVRSKSYRKRSEAFRDLLRQELDQERLQAGGARHCIGMLSYVYNHHERNLARRLTGMQHAQHEVTVATMHAHLDHDQCVETVIVRGRTPAVVGFARAVIAEKGVRHGKFRPIPVDVERGGHSGHVHLHPLHLEFRRQRAPVSAHRRRGCGLTASLV